MKHTILGATALAFCAVFTTTPAEANAIPMTHAQDLQYVSCVSSGWEGTGTHLVDAQSLIAQGHRIAIAVDNGVDPITERNIIYRTTDITSYTAANVMVNCATQVYLGFM